MTDELKAKIKELEEKEREISDEIYRLKQSEKGYWIGIGDNDYSFEYYRLGWCTESEATEMMKKYKFVLGFSVREVTEEYNAKMYKAERLQKIIDILDDGDFSGYEEAKDAMEDELLDLKEELEISEYTRIY